jgi:predicted secreted protein
MIGTTCSFCKVIRNINIPWVGKDPVILFTARFRFLRDLTAVNDSKIVLSKSLPLRSNVSRFSNIDKLSKPAVDLFKKKKKKKKEKEKTSMQFVVFIKNDSIL